MSGEKRKVLRVEKLSKKFNKFSVLKNISLHIPVGSAYALLGPNGSGKTTLLKSLVGSIHYDFGFVDMDHGSTDVQSASYKKRISYMPQHPGFLPHLTARESIELLIQISGREAVFQERLVSELDISRFWNKPFRELSGGMKQKINILQCFMFQSEIFFLDEPTSSLDPQMAGYVKNLIREVKSDGTTVLFTSHIMSEVEDIADQMALLNNGQILIETSPKKFVAERNARDLESAMMQYWKINGI